MLSDQSLLLQLRRSVVALLAIYLFIYPFAIVLVALDKVPVWGTWMGGALLILQGALMGVWLTARYRGWGALAAGLILVISWAVEHIGATTGFPFGFYSYTDVLQPQIFGVVPLAIPFAWLLIVVAAVGVAERILNRDGRPLDDRLMSPTRVLTAASFALLLDVTIEPFAVYINRYWVWMSDETGFYYGIPVSNFVAWWVTSLILSWVLLTLRRQAALRQHPSHHYMPWLPPALYLTNLTMFVVVNLARGQALPALIGGLIMLVLAGDWLLPRLARRLRRVAETNP
ncbi:carotenoid biosynthesis protein [Chloroflexus sp.]|uniref:carotenoid biosynthesis protein n=1 Tax=Chloroflexus sp. TaxID=1904827 RepID=UPI002611E972|nr:carotenoid biosynthesis protein [uncultured Chloroflexus sp.]